jgi:hypothetical protein
MVLVNRIELEDRVSGRYGTLCDVADQLIDSGIFGNEVTLDEAALWRNTEAYFLLNEAYKKHYNIVNTEPPKIAAMSALTLNEFKPLRPRDPNNVTQRYTKFANQILSLSWAARPLGHSFEEIIEKRLRTEGLVRYCKLLSRQKLHSLDKYRRDLIARPHELTSQYDVVLDHDTPLMPSDRSDLPNIDMFVLFFECLWDGTGRMAD